MAIAPWHNRVVQLSLNAALRCARDYGKTILGELPGVMHADGTVVSPIAPDLVGRHVPTDGRFGGLTAQGSAGAQRFHNWCASGFGLTPPFFAARLLLGQPLGIQGLSFGQPLRKLGGRFQ